MNAFVKRPLRSGGTLNPIAIAGACSIVLSLTAAPHSELTDIRGVIYAPNGAVFVGQVAITPERVTKDGSDFGSKIVAVEDGFLSVKLSPKTSSSGTAKYAVAYTTSNNAQTWIESWKVPIGSHLSVNEVCIENCSGRAQSRDISLPLPIADISGLNQALSNANSTITSLTAQINSLSTSIQDMASAITVSGESPAGVIDGSNSNFTLANVPSPSTSLKLYRDGQRLMQNSDFNLSGNNISFAPGHIPQPGDTLTASYKTTSVSKALSHNILRGITLPIPINDVSGLTAALSAINSSISTTVSTVSALNTSLQAIESTTAITAEVPTGQTDGNNAVFTLAHNPTASVDVFKNGIQQRQGVDYTLSGGTITFNSPSVPQSGDTITADYVTSS